MSLGRILTFSRLNASAESHKNEGFLKSIWHKFTDDPEHKAETSNDFTEGKDSEKSAPGNDKKTGSKDESKKDATPKKE